MITVFDKPYRRMTTEEINRAYPDKFVMCINVESNILESGLARGSIGDVVAIADKDDLDQLVEYGATNFAGKTTMSLENTFKDAGEFRIRRVNTDE